MQIDVTKLSNQELDNLIENHRKNRVTDTPLFADALEERAKRKGKGLSFEKSLAIIRSAANERRFLSYKELADASGAKWTDVHYSVGSHLFELVQFAHSKGWPMLSAIVVNKPNVSTGEMEPETLKGFISAARELSLPVLDEKQFLREQQEAVFEWAKRLQTKPEGEG